MTLLRFVDVPADFDLPATNPRIETNLGMHGRAMHNLTISHRELRAMPRALDHPIIKCTFRQWSTEMRTLFCQSQHSTAGLYQNNRNSIDFGPVRLVFP